MVPSLNKDSRTADEIFWEAIAGEREMGVRMFCISCHLGPDALLWWLTACPCDSVFGGNWMQGYWLVLNCSLHRKSRLQLPLLWWESWEQESHLQKQELGTTRLQMQRKAESHPKPPAWSWRGKWRSRPPSSGFMKALECRAIVSIPCTPRWPRWWAACAGAGHWG